MILVSVQINGDVWYLTTVFLSLTVCSRNSPFSAYSIEIWAGLVLYAIFWSNPPLGIEHQTSLRIAFSDEQLIISHTIVVKYLKAPLLHISGFLQTMHKALFQFALFQATVSHHRAERTGELLPVSSFVGNPFEQTLCFLTAELVADKLVAITQYAMIASVFSIILTTAVTDRFVCKMNNLRELCRIE